MKILNNIIRYMFAIAIMALPASCDDDAHKDERGVAIALSWQDEADQGTAINDILLWIYKEDGEAVGEYRYGNAKEIASTLYELEAGDYVLIAGVNLVSPFSVGQAVADGMKTYEELVFLLDDAGASPPHAHYGVTAIHVQGSGVERACVSLRRVLAELTVTIEDAPTGASLSVSVTDAADGIRPARKDSDGGYGSAAGGADTVFLPEAAEQEGRIATGTVRLMPTVPDSDRSHLHFLLTLADVGIREFDADAPVMKPSGKYELTLKYGDMKPYMRLSAADINDWTEGWTIDGEILNPEN